MAKLFLTGGSGFIGGEIAAAALAQGHQVAIYDLVSPHFPDQAPFWTQGDVRDASALADAVAVFRPDVIVHLASDTDVQVTRMEEFTTTLEGTRNAVAAAQRQYGVGKFVHISTQFVVKPGVKPVSETAFDPYTVYGEAKAETERMVRGADLGMPWLIIRPTIIWGPRHPSFRDHIFRHIAKRSYLHPTGARPILRAFGYVTNTAEQILALTLSDEGSGDRHVFYAGDDTIDYDRWADAFSHGLTGKRARRVPMWLLNLMGKAGDVVKRLGLPAPIDSGRAFRMSTSSAIDLTPTTAVTGTPRVSFDEGVAETLDWLRAGPAA